MGDNAEGLYSRLSLWLSAFPSEGKKVADLVCDISLHVSTPNNAILLSGLWRKASIALLRNSATHKTLNGERYQYVFHISFSACLITVSEEPAGGQNTDNILVLLCCK